MKNYKYTIILTFFLLLISTTAFSFVSGGSNLGLMGYPEHTCSKPYKPYEFNDQYELDSYRSEVQTYINCINEYVENANNDIERIREAAQSAIDEANGY